MARLHLKFEKNRDFYDACEEIRRSHDGYLSTKEIAEMMSISVSTVETQLSLAMKYIRSEFEKNSDKLFYLALLVNII